MEGVSFAAAPWSGAANKTYLCILNIFLIAQILISNGRCALF